MCFNFLFCLVVEDSVVPCGHEWIRSRLARTILKHPFAHLHQITLNLSPVEQIAWTTDFPVCWRIDQALKSAGQCKANIWRKWCSWTGFTIMSHKQYFSISIFSITIIINIYGKSSTFTDDGWIYLFSNKGKENERNWEELN